MDNRNMSDAQRQRREQMEGYVPNPANRRSEKIEIAPIKDKDGEAMMKSVDAGNMAAIVSGMEVMYTFLYRKQYLCFIHPFDSEEGRKKAWEANERYRAMLKNLDSTADHIFEIKFKKEMDLMGVMVAAEQAIISYLDMIGQLPAEDSDFMSWKDENQNNTEEGGSEGENV